MISKEQAEHAVYEVSESCTHEKRLLQGEMKSMKKMLKNCQVVLDNDIKVAETIQDHIKPLAHRLLRSPSAASIRPTNNALHPSSMLSDLSHEEDNKVFATMVSDLENVTGVMSKSLNGVLGLQVALNQVDDLLHDLKVFIRTNFPAAINQSVDLQESNNHSPHGGRTGSLEESLLSIKQLLQTHSVWITRQEEQLRCEISARSLAEYHQLEAEKVSHQTNERLEALKLSKESNELRLQKEVHANFIV